MDHRATQWTCQESLLDLSFHMAEHGGPLWLMMLLLHGDYNSSYVFRVRVHSALGTETVSGCVLSAGGHRILFPVCRTSLVSSRRELLPAGFNKQRAIACIPSCCSGLKSLG